VRRRSLTRTAARLASVEGHERVVSGLVIGDADLVHSWPSAGWLVVLALTAQVLGWLLITTSLPRLSAAITSVLLAVQPV
jgi:drug/metabolite transporter (DMT)-like permease